MTPSIGMLNILQLMVSAIAWHACAVEPGAFHPGSSIVRTAQMHYMVCSLLTVMKV